MNVWDQIKQALSLQLSAEGYQNWIHPTTQEMVDGDILLVRVPNAETAEWIEKEYSDSIWTAVRDFGFPLRRILYHPGHRAAASPETPVSNGAGSEAPLESLFSAPTIHLNSKFTFDTFVVGSCNQFAHAAAKAVATTPSNSYNPLFIYGGVGMGKTHLMHAIGRQLLDSYGSLRLIYTTSERFMNQMINCIKLDRMSQFHAHYRTADVLMVDDVQILAGKERTQEEFFHTFNELFDHQKQIILSSDSPPKNTPGLVERLRSRFEWGLMVDVQPPDLETKMAILDKKAEAVGVHLPEDVRIFIATKTKSNIRELEGALIKLIAYSSVTQAPITMEMAQHALKHLATGPEKRITIDSIIRAVAERHTLQPSQLKMKSNERKIAYPRQIAMYLTKELTNASLPEIGRAFGGKHHTTVLHSVQKIESLRQRDGDLNRSIHSLIDALNG
jgi:chromosomal replication initiator protein